jgi:GT2 family glycosyltransferase
MLVSVVIATKDRPSELRATIESVAAQTRPAFEVIVVDQSASSGLDGVREALAQVAAERGNAPELRYRHDRELAGAAPARNVGIELARGDVLVFLDDDVALEPRFLAELVSVYESDPMVAGVSGIITNYSRPRVVDRLLLRLFWLGPFHDERQTIYWDADRLRNDPPIPVRKFGTTGMSLLRSALGGVRFDGRLQGAWPGEDVDLCCRLVDARLLIAPKARFAHKRSPTNRAADHWLRRDAQAMYYLYRRHWEHEVKHRLCFAWLNLGYALLATLASVRRGTLGPWKALLQARRDVGLYESPR